jgi:hypothetical protein
MGRRGTHCLDMDLAVAGNNSDRTPDVAVRRAHSCAGFGRLSVARWASRKACSTGFAVSTRAVA